MSASGHKQTHAVQKAMAALPSKADMCIAIAYVCFEPIADIGVDGTCVRSVLLRPCSHPSCYATAQIAHDDEWRVRQEH